MKVATSHNNFSRGLVDEDINGSFNIPIYQTSSQRLENWLSDFKGNLVYRTGLELILPFQDCALIEFKFSQNQNYIIILYANKMRFLTYASDNTFGWVLDGSSAILEIDTPYTLDECKEIATGQSWTQNHDNMIICHSNHAPRELIRLSANSFTFHISSRYSDPFVVNKGVASTVTGITQATEAVVTVSSAHGYSLGDVVQVSNVVGMTEINGFTCEVLDIPTSTSFTLNINSTDFTAYTSGGDSREIIEADYPALCIYYKSRLWYGRTNKKPTSVWASAGGDYKYFKIPSTITDTSAMAFQVSMLTSPISWFFPAQNSLIIADNEHIVSINGGGTRSAITASNIDFITTSADGANTAIPFSKDGLVFYINNKGRNVNYLSYDLISESFTAPDANILSYAITQTGVTAMRHTKNKYDLFYGLLNNGNLISCNFNKSENIMGWHEEIYNCDVRAIAEISDNDGVKQLFCLTEIDGNFYIERKANHIEYPSLNDSFFTGNELEDINSYIRLQNEHLRKSIHLDNSSYYDDLRNTQIIYNGADKTITDATAPFTSGDVGKIITYKTQTGYEYGKLVIVSLVSSSVVNVTVLIEPTINNYSAWYMSFNTLSGLSRFDGKTISICADGYYLGDYPVSGGVVDLGREVSSVVVGYKYRGVAKTFPLGFSFKGKNTSQYNAAVSSATMRFVNSAGVKFGTSEYKLSPMQKRKNNDLNYEPAALMNTTQHINITDSYKLDKCLYIVQDIPMPCVMTALIVEAKYATKI